MSDENKFPRDDSEFGGDATPNRQQVPSPSQEELDKDRAENPDTSNNDSSYKDGGGQA